MNKGVSIGVIIGVIVIIGIIGILSSQFSEDSPNESTINEQSVAETQSTGRSISIELKESVGMKATP